MERTYPTSPHALFGACLTALGQMRARIERHDVAQGLIVAQIRSAGLFAPPIQLTLQIVPAGAAHARLVIDQPARAHGNPRALATLIEAIDRLLAPV